MEDKLTVTNTPAVLLTYTIVIASLPKINLGLESVTRASDAGYALCGGKCTRTCTYITLFNQLNFKLFLGAHFLRKCQQLTYHTFVIGPISQLHHQLHLKALLCP